MKRETQLSFVQSGGGGTPSLLLNNEPGSFLRGGESSADQRAALGLKVYNSNSTRNSQLHYHATNIHYDLDGKRIWRKSMLSHLLS